MKKNLLKLSFLLLMVVSTLKAQVYLTENFEGAFSGNPAAPAGWSQSRLVSLGDGIPDVGTGEKDWERITNTGPATWSHAWTTPGVQPLNAASGTAVLAINNANFGTTTSALGNRRMESPIVNLAASTNPFVRFRLFSNMPAYYSQFRVMASNDGGTTWHSIMSVVPNTSSTTVMSSNSPWEFINVKIPTAFKVSNAKFGLEITNTGVTANFYIDDFSVQEFNPTTITSLTSGLWSNPSTWVGGVVPTCDNHVVIAATHTVTNNVQILRVQDLTIDGALTYTSTSTTANHNQIFGNLTINATGTYSSCLSTTGKKTYLGGNFINNGVADFQPGSSTSTSGSLNWVGYAGTYSGTGTFNNNRVPQVAHFCAGGVQYLNSFRISNTCGLYNGTVNGTNLTLGGGATNTSFLTERCLGSFNIAPTFDNTNVTQRNMTYITPLTTANPAALYFAHSPTTLNPGNEIESSAGSYSVTGTLQMNTHNNIALSYSLNVGTTTTGFLTLTRGIISTSSANILVCNENVTGALGTIPSTVICNGTVTGGNHGSYINGPIRIQFPNTTNTTTRNFPLGVGAAFHTNLPSTNYRRPLVLASGSTAWTGQNITATIENAPSGTFNAPLTAIIGTRAYRLNFNGGPALPVSAALTLYSDNSTFAGSDNLVGNLQDLRVSQAPSLSGPWSERSLTSGTGPVAANTLYTRLTVSASPGPINNGDEYFSWGTVGNVVDMTALAMPSPATLSCFGPNQTVGISILNSGLIPINFVTNPATLNCIVSGAVNFTFAPVVINTGVLGVSASQTVNVSTTFNMSTPGTYSFDATLTTTGDNNAANDVMTTAQRTVVAASSLPQLVDFTGYTSANLSTLFLGWNEGQGVTTPTNTTSNWITYTGLGGPTNVTARIQLLSATRNEWVYSPKVVATNSTLLTFDAAVTDLTALLGPASMGSDDKVRVMISTDCGVTYVPIYTLNASSNLPNNLTNFAINLSAYAGQEIRIGFLAQDGPIDDPESYYFHLDNINIYNAPATDAGVTNITSPSNSGCFSANENVIVTLKNFGISNITNVPLVVQINGAITQTLNSIYSGVLSPLSTVAVNVGTINMTTVGTYSLKAYSSLAGDGIALNDTSYTTRSVAPTFTLPQTVNFTGFTGANLPTLFPGWVESQGLVSPGSGTTSLWANFTGLNGPTNITTRVQLLGTTRNEWIYGPKVLATNSTVISFDAAVTDLSAVPGPSVMGSDDKVRLMVSTDCGTSFTPIFTLSAANNLPNSLTNFNVNLSAYAGQNIILAFFATDGAIDDPESYYFHLDNINLYNNVAADGGVTAINSPTLNACLSTSETIVVTVKNFGLNAITNFPVTAIIDGPINSTVTSNYTGTLAPNASDTHTIGTANMNFSGSYTINASTGVSGDPNNFNNTSVLITNQTPNFGISGNNIICGSGSATLNVTGAASTYTWFNSSNSSSIIVSPTVTTTYSAIGTGTNNCDVSSVFTVSVINPTITGIGTSVCSPTAVATLTANAFAPVSWYASLTSTNVIGTGNTFTASAASTTTFYAEAVSSANASIATTFSAGNGCQGNMFDVTPTSGSIVVDSLDLHIGATTSQTVFLYYRAGTYVGNETNSSAWIAWDTIVVTGAGAGNPTKVVTVPLLLNNSQVYGFYVTLNTNDLDYSNATATFTNSDLTLQLGAGFCTSAFSSPIASRTWNGNIYYTKPGCTSPKIAVTLTVNPAPTISINTSTNTICVGQTATLTASGADTYTWSTTSNNIVIAVTPTTTSSYTVNATSNSCNEVYSLTTTINVNALPTVSLIAGATTICASPGNIALSGSPNGGVYSGTSVSGNLLSIATAGTFNPVYTYTSSATGCSNSASVTVIVANCTGFNSLSATNSTINVYPNPNQGSFTIDTYNTSEKTIEIIDVTGRVVLLQKATNESIKINIADLANGIYQVKIKSENELHMIKVIKQ